MTSDQSSPGLRGTWRHSTVETFFPGAAASREDPCQVVINDDGLRIGFLDEDYGHVVFQGQERGLGHWPLRASHGGQGTLHGFADAGRLEGYWVVDGWRGMWAVTLSDDPEDG